MKKEYIVLALIIVALSAYLMFKNSDSTHYTLPVLEDIKDKDVTKLEIKKADRSVVIEKKDDSWVVGSELFPADKSKVTPLLDVIKDLKLTALVSESESYARYELDETNKLSVTAWASDAVVRKFDIGKAAGSYRHTFVKLDNDKRVFHADENFRSKFDKNQKQLTDKTVLKFDEATAYTVSVTSGDKTVAYVRKQEPVTVDVTADEKSEGKEDAVPPEPKTKEIWVDADGKEKDKSKISDLIKTVSNLSCVTYIEGAKKEDFTKPVHQLTLHGDKEYTLLIFPQHKDGSNYPAISSESDFPFYLAKDKVDTLKEKLEAI